MRILILAVDTPVGQALANRFKQRERDYVGLARADCRWKSERQAKKTLRRSACDMVVDVRVQAASDGGVRVHDVDVDRTRWVAGASQALKVPYLYVSCARVFAGTADHPYHEEDHADGHSTIANLLIEAESQVVESCERHLLLRVGPVFAPTGINVITHMLAQLAEGETLHLDSCQWGCPNSAEDAARVISALVDQLSCGVEAWGCYHYCSSDITNCFEFAEVLLAAASQYRDYAENVLQLSAIERATVKRRLDCNKIKNTFAIKQEPWRASVAGHVKQVYANQEEDSVQSNRHRDASA